MEKNEKKRKTKISPEGVVGVAATVVAAVGVGYFSYLIGSQVGFNKAVDTVVTKFPYMGFIRNQFSVLSNLL